MEPLDWSALEVDVGDKMALLQRFIADCPNLGLTQTLGPVEGNPQWVDSVEGNFHFVDFSGDGVVDLVYSGRIWTCDVGFFEGMQTVLYHNYKGELTRVVLTAGRITGAWRPGPWEPTSFLVREDGCCDAEYSVYHILHPERARDGTLTYTAGNYVYSRRAMELPDVRFELPRPFRVRQDEYNLRDAPKIPQYTDNILAVYGKGATGIAVGEATGPEGRVWWFVVMDAPTRPLRVRELSYETMFRDPADPRVGGRYAGWMSSRYLDVLPQIPDSLASTKVWWHRDWRRP
jgi:hypothetical protein